MTDEVKRMIEEEREKEKETDFVDGALELDSKPNGSFLCLSMTPTAKENIKLKASVANNDLLIYGTKEEA